jgi:Concanavalin A-like lectin/glucanases superfamily
MAANGISNLSTKQAKQKAKLDIASAKRQGKIVATDGTVSGSVDPTKNYARSRAYYDITQLPTQYSGNGITDNPNSDGLVLGRPWISISYAISPNASAVNEGDTITYSISTVGVADGTTLYWTNSGTTVGADFTGSANSGSFTVNSGTATFTRVLANDYLTEGTETVVVDIRTGSTSGPVVATSGTVSVADTSTPVVDQYGYFEQQLIAGTWMTFDQTIAGVSLRFICTNFDGSLDTVPLVRSSLMHGSYIRVNGVMVASDHTSSPDTPAIDNSVVGGSASFSGTGQYLSTSNSSLNLTGDFTVEGWFYPTNVTGFHALWTFGQASAGRYTVQLSGTSVLSNLYGAGSTTYTSTVPINTWTHVAMVRSGTTVKVYINGTASATTDTQSGTIGNGGYLNIGADDSGATLFAGKITSFRVVNGTAVYTSNFTKSPNPLLPITNTKLLLTELTSGDLVADTGPNKLTLTNNGSVTWNSASPFTAGSPTALPAPSDPPSNNGLGFCMRRGHTIVALNSDGTVQSTNWYDTYNTVGLGTNIAALLRSFLPGTIVAIGTFDATGMNQDFRDCLTNYFGDTTFSNTWGGSRISQMFLAIVKKKILAFNGSSNRIQVGGTRADWNLSTTWTIEFWSKAAVASSSSTILTPLSQQPNSGTIDIIYYMGFLSVNNGTTLCAEPTPGVWTHVAISSAAGVLTVYYNGVSQVSGTVNYSLADTSNDLWIGRRGNNDFQYFNGKLTNIRISNTPRYSTTFTPPLTLVTDANTKLALDGNLVDRSASAHAITNTGTTTSSLDFPT